MTTSPVSAGQLYISHAPDGAAYARKLTAHLRAAGITATFDQHQPHELEMDVVRRRMAHSAALLVVMTEESETAAQVIEEIDLAKQTGLPILGLLRGGTRPFRMKPYDYEIVARGQMPTPGFVEEIGRALGAAPAGPVPPGTVAGPGRDRTRSGPAKQAAIVAGAAALVIAIVGVVFWLGTDLRDKTTDETAKRASSGPATTSAGPSATAPAVPGAGAVTITSHRDGDLVDRCEQIAGTANLGQGKTILFAKMRTTPPDKVWYFAYVGSYRNGFVAPAWKGTVYFGSDAQQRYDLFVIVMDVAAADRFWAGHQSEDGSYAFAPAIPADAERAAVVRVLQGTTDDCR